MKSYLSLTVSLLFVLVTERCEPKSDSGNVCNQAILNKPFVAKIGEEWCLSQTDWKMKLDAAVSYTHLDVYKRQAYGWDIMPVTFNSAGDAR